MEEITDFEDLKNFESNVNISDLFLDTNIDVAKSELTNRSYKINKDIIKSELPETTTDIDELIKKFDNLDADFLKARLPEAPKASEDQKLLIEYWDSVNTYADYIQKIISEPSTRIKETLLKNIGKGGTTFKDIVKINYLKGFERIKSSVNFIPKLINTASSFSESMRNYNEFKSALISDPEFRNIIQQMINEANSAAKKPKEKFTLEYYDNNSISYLLNPDVIATVTYFMILIENGLSPTIAMITYSKILSGCYMITSDKRTKLENCNNYYQNPDNMLKCGCGNIDTDTISIPDCTDLSGDECSKPYCLGKSCKNSINNKQCTINGENVPKCTNANIGDKNYIYYSYLNYQPLTFIPIAKLINKKFYNKYLSQKNNNNYIKYFLIFVSIIFIIFLIIFLYNRFLKKKKLYK
jgi:hypothetical protein